jgi:hypothetical protein
MCRIALGLLTLGLSVAGEVQGQVGQPRSAAWEIVPGRAVGPVAVGMTREEVKTAIGKPDPDKATEHKWWYSADSLGVTFSDDNRVLTISAGLGPPWEGSPPNGFHGRTETGVGMGSTRDAVLVALGTPRSRSENEGLEALYYRELGLVVALWHGEVVEIYVHRAAP